MFLNTTPKTPPPRHLSILYLLLYISAIYFATKNFYTRIKSLTKSPGQSRSRPKEPLLRQYAGILPPFKFAGYLIKPAAGAAGFIIFVPV
jgi:hypothetical protein